NPYAFEPGKRDIDGLSFFRVDFTTPQEVATANRYRTGVRVARVTVQQLRQLGLDVECDPDETQPAGHAIVPGVRYVANRPKEEKRRINFRTPDMA
ncbi:MAG TPA: hypothetical protein VN648_13345, partial [Candidatus Methylomirabilis sp.]|nr:hypothetical protein [Candidatus Methylomirabilis sp.]